MSADRPINADVPESPGPDPKPPEEPKMAPEQRKEAAPRPEREEPTAKLTPKPERTRTAAPPKRRRRPIPGALKLVAALTAIAIAFIAVAVLAGGGSPAGDDSSGATETVTVQAPANDGSESSDGVASELGFPAIATDNTTRVAGSDAAAVAAGVALAVFPSTTPSQRPTAVSLVGEDDWAGAIAAATLIAEPVRAPVLVSGEELPDATSAALAALDPRGARSSGGAAAFAIGDVAVPDWLETKRVKAGEAAATAAAISQLRDELVGSPPDHIVVASAEDPALAMPAAAWAARSGDTVLFADADALPKPTGEILASHRDTPVYVLGPSSAISSKVLRQIGRISDSVKRVSGEDPVANAIAMARYDDDDFGWNVNDPGHGFVLAGEIEPLLAAAAAPLSAAGTWGPLLLTDSADTLPAELRDYFLDVKPGYTNDPTRAFYNHVWVIGDQEAIDVNQQAEVNELAELAKIGSGAP